MFIRHSLWLIAARIRYLLTVPVILSPAILRIDPRWAPLHMDPRFRELAEMESPRDGTR